MSFVFALFVNCTQIQHIFHTIVWLLHYLFLSLYSKSDNSNAGQFQLVIYLPNPMAKTAKNILTLNHEEAMDFFMKSEQYHGFELPEYFTFDEILKYVREIL